MTDKTKFEPIKGDAFLWGDREDGVETLDEGNRDEITTLLLGRKVTRVDGEHLLLDDGTVIKAIGNDGCGGCASGWYDLSVLNGVDNIITRVDFDYRPAGDGIDPEFDEGDTDAPVDEWDGYYRVFVYAGDQRVNLMQFDGSDGNGYYGTGFDLLVRRAA